MPEVRKKAARRTINPAGPAQRIIKRIGHRPMLDGLMVGGLGLALSFVVKAVLPGRLLGDPLPLALLPAALLRSATDSFAYFDWRAPLLHVLFVLFLGTTAVLSLRLRGGRVPSVRLAAHTGLIAGAVNIVAAALSEVDAIVVGVYYAIAGVVSLSLTAYLAAKLVQRWQRRER